jgi:hypothetical protein
MNDGLNQSLVMCHVSASVKIVCIYNRVISTKAPKEKLTASLRGLSLRGGGCWFYMDLAQGQLEFEK